MKLLFVLAAVASMSTAVRAQEAPPSPARIALARQLIGQLHSERLIASVQEASRRAILAGSGTPGSAAQSEKLAIYQQAAGEAMDRLTPKLVGYMEEVYARDFSEQELRDLLAFYNTPTGRAALAKLPLVAQQMGEFMARQVPAIVQQTLVLYCARTECTPEQKARLNQAPPPGSRPAPG